MKPPNSSLAIPSSEGLDWGMPSSNIFSVDPLFDLKSFDVLNLKITSDCLAKNPLEDSPVRSQFILQPKKAKGKLQAVFHLSGYFGTGFQKFAVRTLEMNMPQKIDQLTSTGQMRPALHIFVDATTFWGGSQFIDSPGSGLYGQFVGKELPNELEKHFSLKKGGLVCGASSGGYGALDLISRSNSYFSKAIAVAPDSFFEMSLLPELYKVAHKIKGLGSLSECRKSTMKGEPLTKGSFFSLANVLAMAHCYSAKEDINKRRILWPIDLARGTLDQKIWKKWKKHDPLEFLLKRFKNLQGKKVLLRVGSYDEYHLQYGTRQIRDIFKKHKVRHSYGEFAGGHRGLSAEILVSLSKEL